MQSDKPFITNPIREIAFGDMLSKPNQAGQTSVLIKNIDGQPSKFIRISSPRGAMNIEVEYKEEVVGSYSRRGW